MLRAITPTRRPGAHAVDDLGAAKALDAVAIFAHRPSARGYWQIAKCRVIFELIRLRCSAASVDGHRFRRDELIYALASNGRSWTREPRETAEAFEARIVRDLVEAAHTGREEPILVG